jgi:MbtH protein
MNDEERIDGSTYRVVANSHRQYSLWPHDAPLPAGWFDEGVVGDKDRCLAHIGEVWTELLSRDSTRPEASQAPPDHESAFSATTSLSR